jgi:hypothetical protein
MAEADLRKASGITGAIDISDRCARLLGQICFSGSAIDPRAIRALSALIDSVDVSDRCARSLGQLCFGGIPIDPRDRNWDLNFATDQVDVSGSTVTVSGLTTFTPIAKATVHNTTLPAANADIFGAALSPTTTPTTFRIQACFSIVGSLTADIINGGNEQHVLLNGGQDLLPGVMYIFDVMLLAGDTFNLEYSTTGGTIQVIRIVEIDAAVT